MAIMPISLLIGLIFVGNGLCQLFENPEISNEYDLMASASNFLKPKTLGFTTTNLGNFGPLGYGAIGGIRIGSIGPFHYGYIGGMHTDPFLRASNPNDEDDGIPGTTGTLSGDSRYIGYEQDVIGYPMEQNLLGMDDEAHFARMEPNSQEMVEIGPQMPQDLRAFANNGFFGINKEIKFEKSSPTFITPSHYSRSYSGGHDNSGIHSHTFGNDGTNHGHEHGDDAYRSHKNRFGHGINNKYGHGNSHRYGYGNSHRYGHGSSHESYGSGYGSSYKHRHGNIHKHGYSHGGHSHGSDYGSNHHSQANIHSQSNIYELSHGVPADVYEAIYKKYGSHSHGLHGSHKGLHSSKFRSNNEMEETMMPNNYEFDQSEFEDMDQAPAEPIFR